MKNLEVAGQINESKQRNPAYVIADSDAEVALLIKEFRNIVQNDTLSPTIQSVESLQERFPTTKEESQKN